jgi:hypothetical protein
MYAPSCNNPPTSQSSSIKHLFGKIALTDVTYFQQASLALPAKRKFIF